MTKSGTRNRVSNDVTYVIDAVTVALIWCAAQRAEVGDRVGGS